MNSVAPTILIVDDEIQNCRLLEALLRPEGYLSVSVASGEAALEAVASSPPDLIVLDLILPGMDGYQVARTLKADPATSNIPIIMVTAQLDRSARLAGLEAGAEEFLTLPIDRAELWLRVRNLLRLKAYGNFLQANSSASLEQRAIDRTPRLMNVRDLSGRTVEEKWELLAAISGEIASPLEAMAALMEVLDGCPLSDQQQSLVDDVRRSAVALQSAADGLLAVPK